MANERSDIAPERLAVTEVRQAVGSGCVDEGSSATGQGCARALSGVERRTRSAALDHPGDVDGARSEDLRIRQDGKGHESGRCEAT